MNNEKLADTLAEIDPYLWAQLSGDFHTKRLTQSELAEVQALWHDRLSERYPVGKRPEGQMCPTLGALGLERLDDFIGWLTDEGRETVRKRRSVWEAPKERPEWHDLIEMMDSDGSPHRAYKELQARRKTPPGAADATEPDSTGGDHETDAGKGASGSPGSGEVGGISTDAQRHANQPADCQEDQLAGESRDGGGGSGGEGVDHAQEAVGDTTVSPLPPASLNPSPAWADQRAELKALLRGLAETGRKPSLGEKTAVAAHLSWRRVKRYGASDDFWTLTIEIDPYRAPAQDQGVADREGAGSLP